MTKQQQKSETRRKRAAEKLQQEIARLNKELQAVQLQEQRHSSRADLYKISDGVSVIGSRRSKALLDKMYQRHHAIRYSLAARAIKRRIDRLTRRANPLLRIKPATAPRATKTLLAIDEYFEKDQLQF